LTDALSPIVPGRALGRSGVELSPACFGSMRMLERGLDANAWCALLGEARARGVSTIHSSDEYESFPLFTRVWRQLRSSTGSAPFQHIVKLAEPHFGHEGFDEGRLVERLNAYLGALDVERIDVVQWMWRGDLKDEPGRLERVAAQASAIADAFTRLKKTGKIGAVATFPYTQGFAELLLDAGWNDGFTLYINSLEPEMLPFAQRAAAAGSGIIALRPLAAGRAVDGDGGPRAAMAWALGQPGVCTGVVSFSSLPHLDDLLGATG
jgi:aryl-alcohol dehydrogenase-like predicted oxidoreductase